MKMCVMRIQGTFDIQYRYSENVKGGRISYSKSSNNCTRARGLKIRLSWIGGREHREG